MAITLISRKTARAKIAELLTAITTFVAVYDHQVKDFGGRSPVAMVYSNSTQTDRPAYARQRHGYIVELWWKRTDDDTTEDYIDDLANATRQKLMDNDAIDGFWEDLTFDGQGSEMDYIILDGTLYRRERLTVTCLVICE